MRKLPNWSRGLTINCLPSRNWFTALQYETSFRNFWQSPNHNTHEITYNPESGPCYRYTVSEEERKKRLVFPIIEVDISARRELDTAEEASAPAKQRVKRRVSDFYIIDIDHYKKHIIYFCTGVYFTEYKESYFAMVWQTHDWKLVAKIPIPRDKNEQVVTEVSDLRWKQKKILILRKIEDIIYCVQLYSFKLHGSVECKLKDVTLLDQISMPWQQTFHPLQAFLICGDPEQTATCCGYGDGDEMESWFFGYQGVDHQRVFLLKTQHLSGPGEEGKSIKTKDISIDKGKNVTRMIYNYDFYTTQHDRRWPYLFIGSAHGGCISLHSIKTGEMVLKAGNHDEDDAVWTSELIDAAISDSDVPLPRLDGLLNKDTRERTLSRSSVLRIVSSAIPRQNGNESTEQTKFCVWPLTPDGSGKLRLHTKFTVPHLLSGYSVWGSILVGITDSGWLLIIDMEIGEISRMFWLGFGWIYHRNLLLVWEHVIIHGADGLYVIPLKGGPPNISTLNL